MLCCLVAASKARFMPKLRIPVSVFGYLMSGNKFPVSVIGTLLAWGFGREEAIHQVTLSIQVTLAGFSNFVNECSLIECKC